MITYEKTVDGKLKTTTPLSPKEDIESLNKLNADLKLKKSQKIIIIARYDEEIQLLEAKIAKAIELGVKPDSEITHADVVIPE